VQATQFISRRQHFVMMCRAHELQQSDKFGAVFEQFRGCLFQDRSTIALARSL
jgi:hypothetical protein